MVTGTCLPFNAIEHAVRACQCVATGKNALRPGRAISTLSEQLGRAQILNRTMKISSRIQAHKASIADDLATQGVVRRFTYIVKQITDAGGANRCNCK